MNEKIKHFKLQLARVFDDDLPVKMAKAAGWPIN